MATMKSIALHSYTMLAKQKEGSKNPWEGPRLTVKSMGGSLVRFNVSLNDRSDTDEYYGCTFSIQTLVELTSLIEDKLNTDTEPFEIVISQTRWSKATSEEITGSLCLVRNEKGLCYIKIEMAGKPDVAFPYRAIDKTDFTINGKQPEQNLSCVRCYSWWTRLCVSLDIAAVVLLSLDAGSFGGEDNYNSASGGGSGSKQMDNFDDDISF